MVGNVIGGIVKITAWGLSFGARLLYVNRQDRTKYCTNIPVALLVLHSSLNV